MMQSLMKLPSRNLGVSKVGIAIVLTAITSVAIQIYELYGSEPDGAIAAEIVDRSLPHLSEPTQSQAKSLLSNRLRFERTANDSLSSSQLKLARLDGLNSLDAPQLMQPNSAISTITNLSPHLDYLDYLAQAPNNAQTQIVLHVNPNAGNDRNGNGSPQAPFKTITRALSLLQDGKSAVIQLAPGTYSEDSGEKFPLQLKSGTILFGNETKKGGGINISGGGNYRSPSAGKKNVAIVLANQAQVRGVTITNRDENGYGLWVESITSAAIASNTISGNGKDGIYIGGNATPVVSKNVLVTNKASGIHITDSARPEIQDNLLQSNAVGISINKEAAPQLISNRISSNQDGILSQADAKPILRQNRIEQNKANGMIIANNSMPDLGSANSPGNNLWQGNTETDISNTSRNPLAIVGNQVDPQRLAGTIKVVGATPATASTTNAATATNASNSTPRNTATRVTPAPQIPNSVATARPNPAQTFTVGALPSVPSPSNPNTPIAAPLPNSFNQQLAQPIPNSVIVRIDQQPGSVVPTRTNIDGTLPPVAFHPPAGDPVNQPIVIAPPSSSKPITTPPRFRVVVPISSEASTDRIRKVVPNAFPSRHNGSLVVQVGAYSDRKLANVQVQNLARAGFTAKIELINP
jgi:parallel beta-helix repeat protein